MDNNNSQPYADRDLQVESFAGSVRIPACTATRYVTLLLSDPLNTPQRLVHKAEVIRIENTDKLIPSRAPSPITRRRHQLCCSILRLRCRGWILHCSGVVARTSTVVCVDTLCLLSIKEHPPVHLSNTRPNSSPPLVLFQSLMLIAS